MHINTSAIIQCRMGSSRLPGKVMEDIMGYPLLWHVISRVKRARSLDNVIVATTQNSIDNVIADYCIDNSVNCFRGDEDDVLDRFYKASLDYNVETIVRVTGDCPLIDSDVIDHMVDFYNKGKFDYVTNTLPCTYPDGLDISVFSFSSLEQSWRHARLQSEREHVIPYIRNHPELFKIGSVTNTEDLSHLRWTVDEQTDLEFVRRICQNFNDIYFGMQEIIDLLKIKPELIEINKGISRNEGYAKSLKNDRLIK